MSTCAKIPVAPAWLPEKPEGQNDHLGHPGPPGCAGATCGANGRTRTADRLFTKQLLYRLSYIGTPSHTRRL